MKGPLFYAKILLFGEYGIIKDSKGLAIPFNSYKGALKSAENLTGEAAKSNKNLINFYQYLANLKTDLVALAGYRRAISNFVTIVTGESDIKVNFNSNDQSYTDGKTVTIGARLDDKLFDPSVGLALHEGSHIKLSDFDFLKNLEYEVPQEYFDRGFKKGLMRCTLPPVP